MTSHTIKKLLINAATRCTLCAALIIVSDCSDSIGPDRTVSVWVNQSAVSRMQSVVATIQNTSTESVYYNPCFFELQINDSNNWRTVVGRGCFDYSLQGLRQLRPGDVIADSTVIPPNSPAGQYRVLLDVRKDRVDTSIAPEDRKPPTASNTFRVD